MGPMISRRQNNRDRFKLRLQLCISEQARLRILARFLACCLLHVAVMQLNDMRTAGASCWERQLCCRGRNISCASFRTRDEGFDWHVHVDPNTNLHSNFVSGSFFQSLLQNETEYESQFNAELIPVSSDLKNNSDKHERRHRNSFHAESHGAIASLSQRQPSSLPLRRQLWHSETTSGNHALGEAKGMRTNIFVKRSSRISYDSGNLDTSPANGAFPSLVNLNSVVFVDSRGQNRSFAELLRIFTAARKRNHQLADNNQIAERLRDYPFGDEAENLFSLRHEHRSAPLSATKNLSRNHRDTDSLVGVNEGTDATIEVEPVIRYVIISDHLYPASAEKLANILESASAASLCYCDEECQLLNDCCSDYESVCPVEKCEVSQWSGWGHCEVTQRNRTVSNVAQLQRSFSCGAGNSRRFRQILRRARHGGRSCPVLEEQRACIKEGPDCEIVSTFTYHQPLTKQQSPPCEIYGQARMSGKKNSVYYDITRLEEGTSSVQPEYCIIFEVGYHNRACFDKTSRTQLALNKRICVECQAIAQQVKGNRCVGDGNTTTAINNAISSFWSVIGVRHCNGYWKRLERINDCKCSQDHPNLAAYIFV